MRFASPLVLGFALLATVASACSASDGASPADETQSTPADQADAEAKLPPPSTSEEEDASAPECVPTCATDSDCANSCPATAGAVQCCDLASKTCYASKSAQCPQPQQDSGTPPPAY